MAIVNRRRLRRPINFGEEGKLNSVDYYLSNVSELRKIPVESITVNESIGLLGTNKLSDGLGGTFKWLSKSKLLDNGTTVICPSSNPTLGRWVRASEIQDDLKEIGLDNASLLLSGETNNSNILSKLKAGSNYIAEDCIVAYVDGVIEVSDFTLGSFNFLGGNIFPPSDGIWYIGVDLFNKQLICLPRLGHRGWVPVARVTIANAVVITLQKIVPVMPSSRLPRTIAKIKAGLGLNVVVMGSSLAEGGSSTTDWSGMLFNSASSVNNYRIPGTINFKNIALGGTPNQYLLAQVGFASGYAALDYQDSGFPLTVGTKLPPNGRSSIFSGVDLVVLTILANGGDYRLHCVEPIIRKLREMNIEVILTTDNPQGWPFASYNTITSAALYIDGGECMRVADLYNTELADTAAYVVDATLRYPTSSIYRDNIHMFAAAPAGRVGQPGGGYEVYARAIRSVIPIDATASAPTTNNYLFNNDVDGFTSYGPQGTINHELGIDFAPGRLKVTKSTAADGQWGAQHIATPYKNGNTINVTGKITKFGSWGAGNPSIGMYSGGWASNNILLPEGDFNITLTGNKDATSVTLLFFGNWGLAPAGTGFYVENVTITVNSTYEGAAFETIPLRTYEPQRIAPVRVVTDLKTPADAFVILPKDERHYILSSNPGTLGAHPLGANSFARRFSTNVGASEDMLTLVAGQRAAIAAQGVVGFSMMYYSVTGDPAVTFEVYKNNNLSKTMTIAAQTISRDIYLAIYNPTDHNNSSPNPGNGTIDIRVTSGTLRISALIALTFDMDFLPPESITKIGTWTGKVAGGAPGMLGYATDTLNDYAVVRCPQTGRRVSWLCSSKPNSKALDTWTGNSVTLGGASSGTNHVKVQGNHVGPGETHYIRLAQVQSLTDQATNGYGLHIGGVIITNDR